VRAASKQIHASSHPKLNWSSINCNKVKKKVQELQMRIAKAVRRTTGSPLCRGWPLKGLSRVMGNYHARFLGGLGAAMSPGYPVFSDPATIDFQIFLTFIKIMILFFYGSITIKKA
jgi:hypothetical protein